MDSIKLGRSRQLCRYLDASNSAATVRQCYGKIAPGEPLATPVGLSAKLV
jgi:hypothetical protein